MAKASSVLFHGVVDGFADEVEFDGRVHEVGVDGGDGRVGGVDVELFREALRSEAWTIVREPLISSKSNIKLLNHNI